MAPNRIGMVHRYRFHVRPVAIWSKLLTRAVAQRSQNVRFSNRPFEVKRFQTIRRCGVDVTHGLVLLFGIGTKALPSWDSKTRWNNLLDGLAVS
jgi:hypothetical protein